MDTVNEIREETVEELNDLTKLMIDSFRGYKEAIDQADDSFALKNEFKERAERRSVYIAEIQDYVRSLGGTPEVEGTARGAVHRGWVKFSNLFRDDEEGAVSSVQNGEAYLAECIEDVLEDDDVSADAKSLLQKAHADVAAGRNFAGNMEDRLSALQ